MKSGFELSDVKIIYECFHKSGKVYECVITPVNRNVESVFKIIVKLPNEDTYLPFNLSPAGDGHWVPDNTASIDPWMADTVGRIIINNF